MGEKDQLSLGSLGQLVDVLKNDLESKYHLSMSQLHTIQELQNEVAVHRRASIQLRIVLKHHAKLLEEANELRLENAAKDRELQKYMRLDQKTGDQKSKPNERLVALDHVATKEFESPENASDYMEPHDAECHVTAHFLPKADKRELETCPDLKLDILSQENRKLTCKLDILKKAMDTLKNDRDVLLTTVVSLSAKLQELQVQGNGSPALRQSSKEQALKLNTSSTDNGVCSKDTDLVRSISDDDELATKKGNDNIACATRLSEDNALPSTTTDSESQRQPNKFTLLGEESRILSLQADWASKERKLKMICNHAKQKWTQYRFECHRLRHVGGRARDKLFATQLSALEAERDEHESQLISFRIALERMRQHTLILENRLIALGYNEKLRLPSIVEALEAKSVLQP